MWSYLNLSTQSRLGYDCPYRLLLVAIGRNIWAGIDVANLLTVLRVLKVYYVRNCRGSLRLARLLVHFAISFLSFNGFNDVILRIGLRFRLIFALCLMGSLLFLLVISLFQPSLSDQLKMVVNDH